MKTFESGAQREDTLKGRYDLIPAQALQLINRISKPLAIARERAFVLIPILEEFIITNDAAESFGTLLGYISVSKNIPAYTDKFKCLIKQMLATTLQEGAETYGDRNWEKGLPEENLKNHALNHIYKYMEGDKLERHLEHALCNLMFWYVLTERGYYEKGS
jgi:hypothetical protein